MDGQSYRDECYRQLNDQKFYQKVIDDPTDEINKRECLYLNRLIADDVISKETYNYLLPQNPTAGHFYIFPKIHKAGNPGLPSYQLLGILPEEYQSSLATILIPWWSCYLPA